ncbi:MAG: Gfo/Idh/MocA family oxidoreductase [Alphaproteobacteria bacterium]|jgi:predicted dehydrogenase|nr:Gfo/Idh/MocA family oxidoreductase [Alphaproteobacteria bacterium]
MNAAIVGLGRWGQLLVSSVDGSETIKFTAAVTRTPAKVVDFCAGRGIELSSDLRNVLNDDDIDALVIATPHTQHFQQLMAAAGAGKHVYCEKPWTLDGAQASQSLRALSDAGLKVAIGHNRRFAPNTLAMKKLLQDGDLGAPIHLDGHFDANLVPNEGMWRDSRAESPAGGMTSLGIHAIDMFINFFGRIRDVNVQSKRIASAIDVDDSTLVRINFANGCTGHLTTVSATNLLWRISVFCTGGWAEMRDQDKLEISSIADGTTTQTFPGFEYPAPATIRAALEAFAADVSGGPPYPIPAADIEHATKALAAIVTSAETGETVSLG